MVRKNRSSKGKTTTVKVKQFCNHSISNTNVDSRKAPGFRNHFWENKLFIVESSSKCFFSEVGMTTYVNRDSGSSADLLQFTHICCHPKLRASYKAPKSVIESKF